MKKSVVVSLFVTLIYATCGCAASNKLLSQFMKNISLAVLLLLLIGCKKQFTEEQQPLTPPIPSTIMLSQNMMQLTADTTVDSVWDGQGKVLRINDYRVHGSGTMQNFIIDAPLTQWIFDTTINLKNIKAYDNVFSTAWYGTKTTNTDNWWNIQKSIDVCIANRIECTSPGSGSYKYSKTLNVSTIVDNAYVQTYLHFSGDASYWDNGQGTTFQYTGTTGPAINFQLNKGSIMNNVAFWGLRKSPGGVDSVYYNLTEANYKDLSGFNLSDSYTGVAIDDYPPINGTTRSGSTGIKMENISIGGFSKALAFSQNGITQNCEANSFDYIHFFDNKWCIVTGQPQEKGTSINHIYSWGSVYNVLRHYGAGNYSFDVANIAGRCIEPVQGSIGRWFSSSISNWYCESIGRVCTLSALLPFTFYDCNFDLVFSYSKKRNVIISNSNYVSFTGCIIRYYDGIGGDIWVYNAATFNNCSYYFGQVVRK
jgi:hypothetical protein